MGTIKTHATDDSADAYVASIADEARRADCLALLALMRRVTGEDPKVWSSGLIGFGTYHYRSQSGQEGDWFPVGFASRKAAITVYLGVEIESLAGLLAALGTYKAGRGCIYVKRLSEVDTDVLETLVGQAYANVRKTYG